MSEASAEQGLDGPLQLPRGLQWIQRPAAEPLVHLQQLRIVQLEPVGLCETVGDERRLRAALAQIEVEVAQATQPLGILQQRLFREGSDVRAGQPLFRIDAAPYAAAYESAQAQLAKGQANLAQATALAERYKPLVEANAISKQDYANAVAAPVAVITMSADPSSVSSSSHGAADAPPIASAVLAACAIVRLTMVTCLA